MDLGKGLMPRRVMDFRVMGNLRRSRARLLGFSPKGLSTSRRSNAFTNQVGIANHAQEAPRRAGGVLLLGFVPGFQRGVSGIEAPRGPRPLGAQAA